MNNFTREGKQPLSHNALPFYEEAIDIVRLAGIFRKRVDEAVPAQPSTAPTGPSHTRWSKISTVAIAGKDGNRFVILSNYREPNLTVPVAVHVINKKPNIIVPAFKEKNGTVTILDEELILLAKMPWKWELKYQSPIMRWVLLRNCPLSDKDLMVFKLLFKEKIKFALVAVSETTILVYIEKPAILTLLKTIYGQTGRSFTYMTAAFTCSDFPGSEMEILEVCWKKEEETTNQIIGKFFAAHIKSGAFPSIRVRIKDDKFFVHDKLGSNWASDLRKIDSSRNFLLHRTGTLKTVLTLRAVLMRDKEGRALSENLLEVAIGITGIVYFVSEETLKYLLKELNGNNLRLTPTEMITDPPRGNYEVLIFDQSGQQQ